MTGDCFGKCRMAQQANKKIGEDEDKLDDPLGKNSGNFSWLAFEFFSMVELAQ